jgi:hypothetical protein
MDCGLKRQVASICCDWIAPIDGLADRSMPELWKKPLSTHGTSSSAQIRSAHETRQVTYCRTILIPFLFQYCERLRRDIPRPRNANASAIAISAGLDSVGIAGWTRNTRSSSTLAGNLE